MKKKMKQQYLKRQINIIILEILEKILKQRKELIIPKKKRKI